MKKRTVYIIDSGHDHDALYIKGIKEGWGEERWNIVPVNFLDAEEVGKFLYRDVREKREEIAAIISMNLHLFSIETKIRDFVLASGIPIAIWLFDHPTLKEYINKDLLDGVNLNRLWLICGEPDFIACWQRFFSSDIKIYHKSARLNSRECYENCDESFSSFQKKEIPLLIPCGIGTNPQKAIDCIGKPQLKKMFYSALNLLVKNPYMSPHKGIEYLFRKGNARADYNLALFFTGMVLRYIKYHRRLDVLFNLPKDAKIVFLGQDYPPKFYEKFKNAVFIPCVPLDEFYNLIKKSQIIINFECGPSSLHNRAYNAILTQTAFASHGNNFVDNVFQGGEDFIKYDLKKNDIAEVLSPYLDNPRKTYELTVNARNKIVEMEMLEDTDQIIELMTSGQ
ncbi:MAG: hypothetical protein ACI9S8_000085 [Chlamydiales bacterium]|jgi:hypothetical protein